MSKQAQQPRPAEVNEAVMETRGILDVDGDSRYSYFWASRNRKHPQNVDAMKRMGFEVVPSDDTSVENIYAEKADGGKVIDDLILMRIPVDKAEEIRQRRVEAVYSRVRSEEEKMLSTGSGVDGVENTIFEANSTGKKSFYIANNPIAKK